MLGELGSFHLSQRSIASPDTNPIGALQKIVAAGDFRWFAGPVALLAARSRHHQHQTAHHRDQADRRRDRYPLVLLVLNLQRPHVHILLLAGKRKPAQSKPDNADQDEDNSDDCCWLHEGCLSRVQYLPERRLCAFKSEATPRILRKTIGRFELPGFGESLLEAFRLPASPPPI